MADKAQSNFGSLFAHIAECELKKREGASTAVQSASHWERERDWRGRTVDSASDFAYEFDEDAQQRILIAEDYFELGTRVWDAAILTSKWVEKTVRLPRAAWHSELNFAVQVATDATIFRNEAEILEIGAGTGLLGMVVARLVPSSHVTVTGKRECACASSGITWMCNPDRKPLLAKMVEHVKRNEFANMDVQELEWGSEFPHLHHRSWRLVVASDLAFAVQSVHLLMRTLLDLARQQPSLRFIVSCNSQRDCTPALMHECRALFESVQAIPAEALHDDFRSDRITIYDMQGARLDYEPPSAAKYREGAVGLHADGTELEAGAGAETGKE